MKSATNLLLLFFAVFLFSTGASAQKRSGAFQHCATMTRVQLYQNNANLSRIDNAGKAAAPADGSDQGNFRLQGTVTIPVVVHIVLPNPYLVSDADVQAQIDRLNQDFAGANPDSTNATSFYGVRGHSLIRFALARRTPAGRLTNGVERRFSGTGSDATALTDPIKRSVMGGLDAWSADQYLNLWIGNDMTGQGILGYADNIGPSGGLDDGVFINYLAFGSSSCYTLQAYNRGRTATHEVGHYFGLYHIWGDDNGACSGDDFAQLPSSTNYALPTGLYNPSGQGNGVNDIGDTPNQGDMTTNCPGSTTLDGCSALAPGKMFQDHMDYTQDACLSMFTKKQVARMEWILDNCRAGLKSSLAGQYPANAVALDVAPVAPVSPGGTEVIGCRSVYYADTLSCPGTITPRFRVANNGMDNVTSLTVGYRYDNGPVVTQTVAVSLPPGTSVVAGFAPIAVTVGTHTLRFFTQAPNSGADQVPGNDSLTQSFTVMTPADTPFSEGFETPLPLSGWAIDNPDNNTTWQRTVPGRNGSAGKLSFDNYDEDGTRTIDDLRSTAITVDPTTSYLLTFDVAYKNYPALQNYDSLAVLVSNDCGQTFTRVYYKGGPGLATAGSSQSAYTIPAAADWRTESVNLTGPLLSTGKIIVVFRNINAYGNWLHLDNINLAKAGPRDLRLSAIVNPGTSACSGVLTPSVTVENLGSEEVTSYQVGYQIDNGAMIQQTVTQRLAAGGTATIALPQSTTTVGPHSLKAFTFNPVTGSGTGDSRLINDTLTKTFTVVKRVNSPVVEGFENNFPAAGWTLVNPDNNTAWVRRAPGKASRYAAFFDNYNTNGVGQTDDIRTPFIDVAGADSVVLRFDVAHKNFPTGTGDNLSVLTTADCGNSYTAVYSKSGAALATAGSFSNAYTIPAAADWRTESLTLDAQALASGSLGLAFRNTNGYGNNIFIDNISINSIYKRDIRLLTLQQPKNFVCASSVTPSVTVRNTGTDTVQSFTVVYSINNGSALTQTVGGLALARDQETTVALPASSGLTPGSYSLRVYSTGLLTAKGSGDLNTSNDTLTLAFWVPGSTVAPLVESFSNPVFPPAGWSVLNNDGAYTWQHYSAGSGNSGSAFLNTYNYPALNERDELVTPVVNLGTVDSVSLSFDVAAATYSNPGSTDIPLDTLEILVSKDCGNSFTSVYKKWGAELQTTTDPNSPQLTEFYPQTAGEWRRETVDLSAVATQGPVVVFFRVTNNNENNVFLDNVNLSTKILPAQLKQQGYLVYPAPFKTSFTVWHYQTPTDLKYIKVLTASGQTVWTKSFHSNAEKQEPVDLTGKPAGVYFVELGYTNGRKTESQKIMKE